MLEFDPNPVRPIGNQQDPIDELDVLPGQPGDVPDAVHHRDERHGAHEGRRATWASRPTRSTTAALPPGSKLATENAVNSLRGPDHGRASQEQPALLRSRRGHRSGVRGSARPRRRSRVRRPQPRQGRLRELGCRAVAERSGRPLQHRAPDERERAPRLQREERAAVELGRRSLEDDPSRDGDLRRRAHPHAHEAQRARGARGRARQGHNRQRRRAARVGALEQPVPPDARAQYILRRQRPSGAARGRQGREPPAREKRRRADHRGQTRPG